MVVNIISLMYYPFFRYKSLQEYGLNGAIIVKFVVNTRSWF